MQKLVSHESTQRKEFLRKIEAEGEVNDFESTWVRQDGSLLIVRESARAIRDSQGKTLFYDGTVEDITERRLAESASRYAEEALRENEEKFRSVDENFHDVLFITDTKGIITYISSSVYLIFGYKSEDMKDHFFGEYLDETELARIIPIFEKAIRTGIPTKHLSLLAKRKDGNTFHAELDTSIIEKNGKVEGTTGVIRDISERKRVEESLLRSEEKFRNVFESANVGKSITLPTGEIHVNQAFCDMLGYTQEELKNKKWQEFTPPDEIERIQKILDTLLAGEKDSTRFNKRYIHKNGFFIWADISIVIMRDDERKPLHFITTVIDITEHINAEKELSETKILLEQTFEQSPVPMVLVSMPDAVVRIANPACREFLGMMDEPSYVGTPLMNFIPTFMDYDNEGNIGHVKDLPLARALAGQKTTNEERCIVRKDGTIRWELVNGNQL